MLHTNQIENICSEILVKVEGDLKGHETFNLHNLLDNPYATGDGDMMMQTSFNTIYNASNGLQINVRARPAMKNEKQSLQTESTNQAPAPIRSQIRTENDDLVNRSQKNVFGVSQIVQNQNTECANTTLITTKLNVKTIDNLSKYQLGMHHESSMICDSLML